MGGWEIGRMKGWKDGMEGWDGRMEGRIGCRKLKKRGTGRHSLESRNQHP